jgi:hypothetical protein
VTFSTVRLAVRGGVGTVDLVVPVGGTMSEVAREYAAVAGLTEPPGLVSLTGRPLRPSERVHDLGLEHGDVVVALDDAEHDQDDPPDVLLGTGDAERMDRLGPVLLAVAAGLVAAVVAAYVDSTAWRLGCAGVLITAAVLALLPRRGTSVSAVAAPRSPGATRSPSRTTESAIARSSRNRASAPAVTGMTTAIAR